MSRTVLVLAVCTTTVTWAQAPAISVAVVARAIQPGEVARIDVTCACGEVAPRASALGLDIPLTRSPDGSRWQGLLGLDVDLAPGSYPLVVRHPGLPGEPPHETQLTVGPKQFRTRTLRVAPDYVDPPADLLERILDEAATFDRLWKIRTPRAWDRSFGLPLRTAPTRNFGSRSIFNGEPRSPHAGIDFGGSAGAVVTAPAAGTVVLAADLFFTGHTVVIDHGAGLYSLYAHLSSMSVGDGDAIVPGTALGTVGATGRATGPHLHWGVRLNGSRVDPLSLLVATQD
jgi:murein DD-endopeptidase MepM/ murein hydrolase activator NlpD